MRSRQMTSPSENPQRFYTRPALQFGFQTKIARPLGALQSMGETKRDIPMFVLGIP